MDARQRGRGRRGGRNEKGIDGGSRVKRLERETKGWGERGEEEIIFHFLLKHVNLINLVEKRTKFIFRALLHKYGKGYGRSNYVRKHRKDRAWKGMALYNTSQPRFNVFIDEMMPKPRIHHTTFCPVRQHFDKRR